MRNNKVNEELQRQANEISEKQLDATWANIRVTERNVEATISMQNYLKGQEHIEKGTKTYSSSATNYYEVKDKDGNITKKYVNESTDLVKHENGKNAMWQDNGSFYVQDSDGNVHKVYNTDKEHADKYAKDHHTISNYKE